MNINKLIFKIFIYITLIQTISYSNYISDDYWLKLLHYKDGISTIASKDFFISPYGKTNPKLELDATIKKFNFDTNSICKYPARFKWIKSQNLINTKMPKCKQLDTYLSKNINNISVIFTSPRYDSPGSIFGHTFLKLKTNNISYALNYSAIVNKKINSLSYAYKGITGKYNAKYTLLPYSRKDYEYRAEEARDLLKFELNLTEDNINNILLHMYEIRNITQNYYFLSDNCSSELLKLLDMYKYTSSMSNNLDTIVVPIDIIYILEENKLINNIYKNISRIKYFYKYVNTLNSNERIILNKLISYTLSSREFKKMKIPFISKKNIVISAIKYIEINSLKEKYNKRRISLLFKLISLKNIYKITTNESRNIKLNKNPISNKIKKLYISKEYSNKSYKTILGFRPLYSNRHDLMNKNISFGSIELFDISIRRYKSITQLNSLLLLNLEANPPSTEFFNTLTTAIKIGSKRIIYFDDLMYSYLNYYKGYNYMINDNFYNKFELGIESIYYNKPIYNLDSKISFEYYYEDKLNSEIILNYKNYSSGIKSLTLKINTSFKINKNNLLNLSILQSRQKNIYNSISLAYNIMF